MDNNNASSGTKTIDFHLDSYDPILRVGDLEVINNFLEISQNNLESVQNIQKQLRIRSANFIDSLFT